MKDPDRLLDDALAPRELRDLLGRAPRARVLDARRREHGRLRLAHLAAPATLLASVSLSGKAVALSAAIGAVAGAVTIGAISIVAPAVEQLGEPDRAPVQSAPPRGVLRDPMPLAQAPSDPPATVVVEPETPISEPQRRPAPPRGNASVTPSAPAGTLSEESRLLELARRALQEDPARALALCHRHELAFGRPRLGAERTLIAIEALYRLDRHAEARSLAEQWLARGADDLYRERVQRLLEKID